MRLGTFIGAVSGPLLGLALVTGAGAPDLSGLVNNSPFGEVEKAAEKPSDQAPQFELRGVIKEKDGFLLNVFDLATKKSAWVREGDRTAGYLLRKYDLTDETAFLEFAGKTVALTLRTASRRRDAGASDPGQPAPAVTVAQMRVNAPAPGASPSPDGEARRLGQVAEQIKLRREQRQRTANGESKT